MHYNKFYTVPASVGFGQRLLASRAAAAPLQAPGARS